MEITLKYYLPDEQNDYILSMEAKNLYDALYNIQKRIFKNLNSSTLSEEEIEGYEKMHLILIDEMHKVEHLF